MKRILPFLIFLPMSFCLHAQSVSDINKQLYNSASFAVPSSPAFELLPDKPSEVTHLVTAHDVTTNVLPLFMTGSKLQQGVSFDGRPLVYFVGSLSEYQANYLKRLMARLVLSLGTAPLAKTNDMFISGGVRIPLIDKGDARNSTKYITALETGFIKALEELGQPGLGSTSAVMEARTKYASSKIESIRKNFADTVWNKLKWDVGAALMYRAAESKIDALYKNRSGVWTAVSVPFGKHTQLIVSGKTSWIQTDSAKQESGRTVSGAKIRWFGENYKLGLSGEFAYVWTTYEQKDLNASWKHYAVMAEFPIVKWGSYLGLVVGFDGQKKTSNNPKVEFKYAFYTDRLIKK